MRKTKHQRPPQDEIECRLASIKHLLAVDLRKATFDQEEAARSDVKNRPSHLELLLAVKRWARALADVCRSHARECAQLHANRNQQDSATSAMGTVVIVLSEHLGLPSDGTLFHDNWPPGNRLQDFVLEVAGAPVEVIDGEIVRKPVLPRWEPISRFARRIAGLNPDPPEGKNATFLSVDETHEHLRGLRESFQKTLFENLGTSFSEAVLGSPSIVPSGCRTSLSEFDEAAGRLFAEAKKVEKRVSRDTLIKIAEELDKSFSPPLNYLEQKHRNMVALHNKQHPRAALRTWKALVANDRFAGAVRRRLYRAAEKYSDFVRLNSHGQLSVPASTPSNHCL